jgi:glutamate/tyrosine decarboxylase-like PLP-dependent enzyme
MQRDIVDHALDLLHAPPEARGVVTSGGTESVILALKAAVKRAQGVGGWRCMKWRWWPLSRRTRASTRLRNS